MAKSDYVQEMALKIKKLRKARGLNGPQMANELRLNRSSYYRLERGDTIPSLNTAMTLAKKMNISLDWLYMNRGDVYYLEKAPQGKTEKAETTDQNQINEPLPADLEEMMKYALQVPLLKFELLATFHRFKEDRPNLLEPVDEKEKK
jgi:transcriptional regulator with XRE-family HTH domain